MAHATASHATQHSQRITNAPSRPHAPPTFSLNKAIQIYTASRLQALLSTVKLYYGVWTHALSRTRCMHGCTQTTPYLPRLYILHQPARSPAHTALSVYGLQDPIAILCMGKRDCSRHRIHAYNSTGPPSALKPAKLLKTVLDCSPFMTGVS
jgi:hypothetical protein